MNPSKYLGNELKYLEKVLNSDSWSGTGGSWNNALETVFCEKFGVKYAIAMNSGTATLHSALVAVGVGQGDEVIVPALGPIMTSTAVIHAGATPVYCDVNSQSFNIDPEEIHKHITPRTKVIIPVSLYGLPADTERIFFAARAMNLIVIDDNAQCCQPSIPFAHCSSYSFENSKHISCGEGGILTTNYGSLAEKVRKVAGHGFKNLRAEEGRIRLNQDVFQDPDYKRHDVIGYNYRMPEFNAAIALAQIERIDELLKMRRDVAELFLEEMNPSPMFMPQERKGNSYYALAAVYLREDWKEFRKAYIANGGDGIYAAWSVPYKEPALEGRVTGNCPIAESLQPKIMQFKTNYRDMDLAKQKAKALATTIREFK